MKIRQHPFVIVSKYLSLGAVINAIGFIVLVFVVDFTVLALIAGFLILALILALRFIAWKNTYLELDDEVITLSTKTMLQAKQKVMKRSKIASVNINSSFLERLLQIGNASITSKTSIGNKEDSIDVLITKTEYERLRLLLNEKQTETTVSKSDAEAVETAEILPESYLYEKKYSFGDALGFLILGVPRFTLFLMSYLLFGVFETFFLEQNASLINIVFILVGIGPILSVFSSISNLDVKIREDKRMSIHSSLLSEQHIESSFDDIRIVYETKYQLFKNSAFKIGIVNSMFSAEDNIVTEPIISLFISGKERIKMLSLFGLAEQESQLKVKASPFAIRRNIIVYSLTLLISLLVIFLGHSLISPYFLLGFFILPFIIIHFVLGFIALKNYNFIEITDSTLNLSRNFIYNKCTYCDFDHIESYSIHQGPISRLFKIADLKVTTFKNSMQAEHVLTVKSYNYKELEEVAKLLDAHIS